MLLPGKAFRYYFTFISKIAILSEEEVRNKVQQSSIPVEHQEESLHWIQQHSGNLPDRAITAVINNLEHFFSFEKQPKPLFEIVNPGDLNATVRAARQQAVAERPTELASAISNLSAQSFYDELRSAFPKEGSEVIKHLQGLMKSILSNPGSFFDIPEQYRPMAVVWLKNHIKDIVDGGLIHEYDETDDEDEPTSIADLLTASIREAMSYIEKFILFNNYVEEGHRDLLQVKSLHELGMLAGDAVTKSHDAGTKLRGAKYKKKITEGLEKLGEDEDWLVYAPHNMEAACHIGNGTSWCTSARGDGNMFDEYYKANDQLYVFINKANPDEKYQFHYGSNQFKNAEDRDVKDDDLIKKLNHLLIKLTGANTKNPIVKFYSAKEKIDELSKNINSKDDEKQLKKLTENAFNDLRASQKNGDNNVNAHLVYLINMNPLMLAGLHSSEAYDMYRSYGGNLYVHKILEAFNGLVDGAADYDKSELAQAAKSAEVLLDIRSIDIRSDLNFLMIENAAQKLLKSKFLLKNPHWIKIANIVIEKLNEITKHMISFEKIHPLKNHESSAYSSLAEQLTNAKQTEAPSLPAV